MASITAAEQLMSVPRFFCVGQMAKPVVIATNATITGIRYGADELLNFQKPTSVVEEIKFDQPNICFRLSQNAAVSCSRNAITPISTSHVPTTPTRNRHSPLCQ